MAGRAPRGALFALLLCFLTSHCLARRYSSHDLPSPQKDASDVCRRGGKKSAVCDPDGLLSASDADTLDGLSNFIEAGTHGFKQGLTCSGSPAGAQIAVAIFDSMTGSGDKEKRAFRFARDLHDRWGVGDASCQNGVVVVLAVQDRAMGFSIGAGVRSAFPDSLLPRVMDIMKPKLREQQYGLALEDAINAIGNIVSGAPPPPPPTEANFSDIFGFLQVAAFVACFSCCTCMSNRNRGRYQQCRKALEKIDADRAKANNNDYVATSCPICLEDFAVGEGSLESQNDGDVGADESVSVNISENGTTPTRTLRAGLRQTAAGRATNSATDSAQDAVRTLPCGHKFHEGCIVTWFSGPRENNNQCPICRQPIVEDEGTRSTEARVDYSHRGGWDVYDPEYAFRVRRARAFYPDFITYSMMTSWERDRYQSHRPMATSTAFTAVNPAVVAAARSSGGGGSSFSFGGGSSGGGGGGGGSW